MPGFNNDVVYAGNVDFSGGAVPAAQLVADGQLIIGATGLNPGVAVLASADGSVTITNAAGTIDLASVGLDQVNILYVGKHGNDANDGLTINKAYLTFGAALAAAAATDAIVCLDDGIYVENLVDPTGLTIHAPNATLTGTHTMIDGSEWLFKSAMVATATIGFNLNIAAAETHLKLDNMIVAGTGIGAACLQGKMFCEIQHIEIANGFAIGATTTDEIYLKFEEIDISGTGYAFGIAAAGDINVIGNCVEDGGAGGLFFAAGAGSNIAAQISKVEVQNLSNITAATNVRLNVARLAGALAEVGAGGIDGICGANRIDGVPIGAVTPSTGVFTAVTDNSRTQYAVCVYAAGGALDEVATLGAAGEVLTSNGAGAEPTWQAGGGGGGLTWALIAVNANIADGNGYIANKAGLLTMTLPAASVVGEQFAITNINQAAGWLIAQGANQYIRMGIQVSTVGAGGSLSSTALGDSVYCVCTETDLGWVVVNSVGNITVT